MKKKTALLVILIALIGFSGCGGDLTGSGDSDDVYTIRAVLVKLQETDTARIDVLLTKNGDTSKSAVISLGGNELDTNETGYYKDYIAGQLPIDTDYTLNVSDSGSIDIDFSIRLSDAVTITDAGFRFYTGSAEAVNWTGGGMGTGYILATMPPGSATVDTGYTAYTGILTGTIPSEAFEMNLSDRIEGIHKIYVASYTGAPIASDFIPFDLPKTLVPADNVSETNITGRTAGIVVAVPDSISVSN